MTTCLAPACPAPRVDLGPYAFLCVPHALQVARVEIAASRPRQAPSRPDLRRRCWGEGLTCRAPAAASTAHGTYCPEHLPEQPRPVVIEPSIEDERAQQLAALAVMGAFPGATISPEGPSLWATRLYGDNHRGPGPAPIRRYRRDTPSRAITVELDDERVPRTARAMAKAASSAGWSARLRVVDDPPSCMLKAWRGALLVVSTWYDGSFASSWVQHSNSMPMRLQARQASALIKVA